MTVIRFFNVFKELQFQENGEGAGRREESGELFIQDIFPQSPTMSLRGTCAVSSCRVGAPYVCIPYRTSGDIPSRPMR